jgi:RNA-binding protein 39
MLFTCFLNKSRFVSTNSLCLVLLIQVGKVKQVIMIRDKYTNRHKGFCYVEMKELDSIPLVLMLHNAVPDFQKFPILIKASEAEKNFLKKQETTIAAAAAETARKDRLFVSNLHPSLGEDDLVTVLGAFGRILKVTLNKDPVTGASLGAGIVKFEQEEDAAVALGKIQGEGLELMGSALQVMYYSEPTAPAIPQQGAWNMDQGNNGGSLDAAGRLALMQRLGGGAAATPLPGMPPPMGLQHCNPGMGMPPQGIMPGMGFPQGLQGVAPPPPMAPMGRGQSNLPAWMTQGGIQPAAAPGAAAAVPAPAPAVPPVRAVIGSPSITVLIRNMFDPATETEPEWDVDITEDTTEECSRFGEVKHCYVEPKEPGGLVYLCFGTLASAAGAAAHLNGRWFAGRTITVEYLDPQVYMAKCPDAAAVVAASLQNA